MLLRDMLPWDMLPWDMKPGTFKVHHITTNSIANTVLIINIINNRLKLIVFIFIFLFITGVLNPLIKKRYPGTFGKTQRSSKT